MTHALHICFGPFVSYMWSFALYSDCILASFGDLLCVAQPRHVSFEPAWAVLEHELAAQIHISMKQYFARLKEVEPDNAFRPDTLVCFLRSLYCVCA